MKDVKYIFKLKEMKFPEESNSQSRKPVTGNISRSTVLKNKGWRKPSGGDPQTLSQSQGSGKTTVFKSLIQESGKET